jgi:hypothetical protein
MLFLSEISNTFKGKGLNFDAAEIEWEWKASHGNHCL